MRAPLAVLCEGFLDRANAQKTVEPLERGGGVERVRVIRGGYGVSRWEDCCRAT